MEVQQELWSRGRLAPLGKKTLTYLEGVLDFCMVLLEERLSISGWAVSEKREGENISHFSRPSQARPHRRTLVGVELAGSQQPPG